MDNRTFSSPNKYYLDDSLLPSGQRRIKTSTPRGRRPNPYDRSPDNSPGFLSFTSPPSESYRSNSKRISNDSWKSCDSSHNSSFNSSYNSPGGRSFSPGQHKQRYHGAFRRNQDVNANGGYANIAAYYHPSMMENPWLDLEQKSELSPYTVDKRQNSSRVSSSDYVVSSEVDRLDNSSDREHSSPEVLVESVTEVSYDALKDESSLSVTHRNHCKV